MIISDQTRSVSICTSSTATLSISAGGSGPFVYQWQWKESGTGAPWRDVGVGINVDSDGHPCFVASDPTLASLSIDPQYGPFTAAGTIQSVRCVVAGVCGFVVSDVIPFSFCVSDFSCDGNVDDADFVVFATGYNILDCADPSMAAGCPADLNGDGLVDDADFVLFVHAYNNLGCE